MELWERHFGSVEIIIHMSAMNCYVLRSLSFIRSIASWVHLAQISKELMIYSPRVPNWRICSIPFTRPDPEDFYLIMQSVADVLCITNYDAFHNLSFQKIIFRPLYPSWKCWVLDWFVWFEDLTMFDNILDTWQLLNPWIQEQDTITSNMQNVVSLSL